MRRIIIKQEVVLDAVKTSKTKKEACKKLNIDIGTFNRLLNDYSII